MTSSSRVNGNVVFCAKQCDANNSTDDIAVKYILTRIILSFFVSFALDYIGRIQTAGPFQLGGQSEECNCKHDC